MLKRWRFAGVLALVLALAVVLAACGGTEEEPEETMAPEPEQMDIVDTAVAAGDFTTLTAALEAAGLVETLKGDGPFTVFAPNDAAFAKVPQETLDALLADPEGDLTSILTYHVVPGKVMSTDLSDGMMAATVNGAELTITIGDDGTVMVDGATVITADIEASNGVIHVIDTVMIPPSR